jgi:predicted ester cyclase
MNHRKRIGAILIGLGLLCSLVWPLVAQDDPALVEQNKVAARRVVEDLFNGADLTQATVEALYHESATLHAPNSPAEFGTTADFGTLTLEMRTSYLEYLREGFPDLQLTIEQSMAEGDMVSVLYTARGTHENKVSGPTAWYLGTSISPTGQTIEWDGVFVFRFVDGRIAEEWWYWDNALFALIDYAIVK